MPGFRALVLAVLVSVSLALPRDAVAAPGLNAQAIVLVNSTSAYSHDFDAFVQPYLDNFGVPYTTVDIASASVPATIANFALIIVGHRQIDASGRYLDDAEQQAIVAAVRAGTGLVNFDGDLWQNSGSRYPFVQDIFRFTPGTASVASGVTFPASNQAAGPHYIAAAHQAGEVLKTGSMHLPGFGLPSSGQAVVLSGHDALVSTAEFGGGRGVQWASYEWMSHSVLGPMHGLDDVVWRSFVWAARKPFVMQALPPIVTMRVDDATGPFGWAHVANEFGLKPWIGIFLAEIKEADAADLRSLVHAGGATASMHGFGANEFFYFNHHDHLRVHLGFDALTSRLSLGGRVASGGLALALVLLAGTAWRRSVASGRIGEAIAAGVLFGLSSFIKLKVAEALLGLFVVALIAVWRTGRRPALRVTVVAAVISMVMFGVWSLGLRSVLIGPGDWPDDTIAANYARATRWHEVHGIPVSTYVVPHFYEFGANAFTGLANWGVKYVGTQIAPGVGYGGPWLRGGPYRRFEDGNSEGDVPSYYADFLTVPGHAEFDGRFFNCVTEIRDDNGYEWSPTANVPVTVGHGTRQLRRALDSRALATLFTHEYFLADIPGSNWRNILQDVTSNIASYHPRYMTMDDACQYVRALHTSSITSSVFDPETGLLRTDLAGTSDVETTFALFTSPGGTIVEQSVAVPPFTGSTQVRVSVTGQVVNEQGSAH